MRSAIVRGGAIGAISLLATGALWIGWQIGLALLLIGILVFAVQRKHPVFVWLAGPLDHDVGRLIDLGSVSLIAGCAAIGLAADVGGLTPIVFMTAMWIVAGGAISGTIVDTIYPGDLPQWTAFVGGGTAGGILSHTIATTTDPIVSLSPALLLFLVVTGGLIGALFRELIPHPETAPALIAVLALAGVLATFGVDVGLTDVAIAVIVTLGLAVFAYLSGTASITGLAAGVLLGVITLVYGGIAWFAVLFTFVMGGAIATKYRFEEKAARGVAEEDQGARGVGNVVGNSAIALLAVIGYQGAGDLVPGAPELFLLAFVGSMSTALADTLSSELGVLFDQPRLITTLEPIESGENGGVTWQGGFAGLGGGAFIGATAMAMFAVIGPALALVIALAGFLGMVFDSLLGATIEDRFLGNEGVNLLATAGGAVLTVLLAVILGLT